jgi:hypothetical protein
VSFISTLPDLLISSDRLEARRNSGIFATLTLKAAEQQQSGKIAVGDEMG